MKLILTTATLAMSLGGCALFQPQQASIEPTLATPSPRTAVVRENPPVAREVSLEAQSRQATMGPRGIVPCAETDTIISACRGDGYRHLELERELTPATSVSEVGVLSTSFESQH